MPQASDLDLSLLSEGFSLSMQIVAAFAGHVANELTGDKPVITAIAWGGSATAPEYLGYQAHSFAAVVGWSAAATSITTVDAMTELMEQDMETQGDHFAASSLVAERQFTPRNWGGAIQSRW